MTTGYEQPGDPAFEGGAAFERHLNDNFPNGPKVTDICIDCDGRGKYLSGAQCISCGGIGKVFEGDGLKPDPSHPSHVLGMEK